MCLPQTSIDNVSWQRDRVLFVSLNVPGGSNNDADPWYGAPSASPQQATEATNRTNAALRWLDRTFSTAGKVHARAVVVMTQADIVGPQNFHRVVVHGSTVPLEYLRLTANPKNQRRTLTSFGPFSWQRVTQ